MPLDTKHLSLNQALRVLGLAKTPSPGSKLPRFDVFDEDTGEVILCRVNASECWRGLRARGRIV